MAMKRGASLPAGGMGNPFWSQRTKEEWQLRAVRPADLPVPEDEETQRQLRRQTGQRCLERKTNQGEEFSFRRMTKERIMFTLNGTRVPSQPPPVDPIGLLKMPELPPWPVDLWKGYEKDMSGRKRFKRLGEEPYINQPESCKTYHLNILAAGWIPDKEYVIKNLSWEPQLQIEKDGFFENWFRCNRR